MTCLILGFMMGAYIATNGNDSEGATASTYRLLQAWYTLHVRDRWMLQFWQAAGIDLTADVPPAAVAAAATSIVTIGLARLLRHEERPIMQQKSMVQARYMHEGPPHAEERNDMRPYLHGNTKVLAAMIEPPRRILRKHFSGD